MSTLTSIVFFSSTAVAQPVVNQNILVDLSGPDLAITVQAELQLDTPTRSVVMLRPFAPVLGAELGGEALSFRPHPQAPDFVDIAETTNAVGPGVVSLNFMIVGDPNCQVPGTNQVMCVHDANQTILTPSGQSGAWYHQDLFGDGLFTGQIEVIAKTDQTVLAGQGPAVEVATFPDAELRHRFSIDLPTPLLGLYVGRYPVDAIDSPFVVKTHKGPQAPQDILRSAGERGARAIEHMQQFMGAYPVSEAHLVAIPGNFAFGGMGLHGTVFIQDRIFSDFQYILKAGVAHEFAHTYWGHQASGADESAYFFSEGFAEYTAWRALGLDEGEEARRNGVRLNSVWYMFARPGGEDTPIVHPDTPRSPAYVHVAYHKASSVLRMLEHRMGKAAFDQVLAGLQALGPGGLSVAALKDLTTQYGLQETEFIDRWLLAPGFPEVSIQTRRIDQDLELEITASGDFSLELPVAITALDGTSSTETLSVRSGTQTIRRAAVSEMEVDPDWTHLRSVRSSNQDVTFDGVVDAADLMAVALKVGTALPRARRQDGGYDPLFDLNEDRRVDAADLELLQP